MRSHADFGWRRGGAWLLGSAPVRRLLAGGDRRRLAWIAVPVVLVLAAALAGFLGREPGVALPSVKVERGDVRITLTESGELRAAQQTTVSATNDKQIVWLVPEGSRVAKGDLLIRFEAGKYELAKSTADATGSIGKKIAAIQGGIAGATAALGQVGEIIRKVNELSSTIAVSVEEQRVTTQEISRTLSDVARGALSISSTLSEVQRASENTTGCSGETRNAAGQVAATAGELRGLVEQFRT